jgi:hypothetical protein
MADQITTAFKRQFADTYRIVAQQMISEFRARVRVEPISGNIAYVDYIGIAPQRMVQQTLVAPTNLQEIPHSKRVIMAFPYPLAVPVPKPAMSRFIADPTGTYLQVILAEANRLIDWTLMQAAISSAATVSTDQLTPGSVSLPAGQTYTESGTVGATTWKVARAMTSFNLNNLGGKQWHKWLALSPLGIEDLLMEPEIQLSTVHQVALEAIKQGEVKNLFGFETVMSNELPFNSGTNMRTCVAWIKEGLCLGLNEDYEVDIGPRRDLNNLTQIWTNIDIGATRMQETHVYAFQCYEDPGRNVPADVL